MEKLLNMAFAVSGTKRELSRENQQSARQHNVGLGFLISFYLIQNYCGTWHNIRM